MIEGHLAIVPGAIPFPDGTLARPNDPLPLPGDKVRKKLMKDRGTVAQQISATLAHLRCFLPSSLWPETGTRVKYITDYAAGITQHFYVRIVDKGVGVMWAFCHHCSWHVLQGFLQAEGYVPAPLTPSAAVKSIRSDIMRRG